MSCGHPWLSGRIKLVGFAIVAMVAGCDGGGGGGGSDGGDNACPADDDRSSTNNLCRILVGQCPHRGGDCIHDICADNRPIPGNVAWDGQFLTNQQRRDTIDPRNGCPPNSGPDGGPPLGRAGQGCDVSLAGREFDALSWDEQQQTPIVWEVKTWSWSTFPDDCKQKKLAAAQKVYVDDCNIVLSCDKGINDPIYKIRYRLAVSDQPLFGAMMDWLMKNRDVLPVEGGTYCAMDDAQSCR